MTGTWPELPERALNNICISLKFLHTFEWNPPIHSTTVIVCVCERLYYIGRGTRTSMDPDLKGALVGMRLCVCTPMRDER